jgi:hypothetical protein
MQYGAFNNAGTDMTTLTSSNTFRTLSVLNSGTEGDAGQPKHAVYAECRNASGAALRAVGFNAGGVHATSTSPRNLAAGAVYARGGDNCGVVAISDTGAPLRLGNAVRNSVPVDAADGAWLAGDFLMLPSGQLWVCVAGGTPGVWRMLASPQAAGAFVPVTPSRVFDSRQQPPVGPLLAGSSRVVSVANSYVVNSNTVSTTNRVPVGATAIAVNLTVTAQTAPGYVYLGPGNAVTITASSINWTTGGATVANALIVPVSGAAREVRAFLRSAPGATAHVVLDVSGYFMGR